MSDDAGNTTEPPGEENLRGAPDAGGTPTAEDEAGDTDDEIEHALQRRTPEGQAQARERSLAEEAAEFARAEVLRDRLRDVGINLRMVDFTGSTTKEERAVNREIPWEQGFVTVLGPHGTQFSLAIDDLERLLAMIGPRPGGGGETDRPERNPAPPAEGGPGHDGPPP